MTRFNFTFRHPNGALIALQAECDDDRVCAIADQVLAAAEATAGGPVRLVAVLAVPVVRRVFTEFVTR